MCQVYAEDAYAKGNAYKEGIVNKYRIVEKATEQVVHEGLRSREEARNVKRSLELAKQKETGSQNRPSAYFVETGDYHPNGGGIYLH